MQSLCSTLVSEDLDNRTLFCFSRVVYRCKKVGGYTFEWASHQAESVFVLELQAKSSESGVDKALPTKSTLSSVPLVLSNFTSRHTLHHPHHLTQLAGFSPT